jgi:hypothetical protein
VQPDAPYTSTADDAQDDGGVEAATVRPCAPSTSAADIGQHDGASGSDAANLRLDHLEPRQGDGGEAVDV